MKHDQIVLNRFKELEQKAEEISSQGFGENDFPGNFFAGWGTSALNLVQRVFGEQSIHYKNLLDLYQGFSGYRYDFNRFNAVFLAAKEDYEGGFLFNLRSLVKAEVLDDSFEQARELLKAGYKDPACILSGIALEVALKDLCLRNTIDLAKLDKMNSDLAKAEIYNLAKQKQITAWADLRNKAAHGEWAEYDDADVEDMIKGVERFVADFL